MRRVIGRELLCTFTRCQAVPPLRPFSQEALEGQAAGGKRDSLVRRRQGYALRTRHKLPEIYPALTEPRKAQERETTELEKKRKGYQRALLHSSL